MLMVKKPLIDSSCRRRPVSISPESSDSGKRRNNENDVSQIPVKYQCGMTLVELMVGSVISLIALATVVTVYSTTARHAGRQLREADLRQQLYAISALLATDLRRAGYWWFDPQLTPASDNPFEKAGNRLRIGAIDQQPADSCILYSYDLDADGLVGNGHCPQRGCGKLSDDDNVEQFGFRLKNGKVQSRYGGRTFRCDSGNWQTLTTGNVIIDSLHFTLHTDCINLMERGQDCQADMPSLEQHAVAFQLKGHISRRDDIALDISRWVQVRNDRLVEPRP